MPYAKKIRELRYLSSTTMSTTFVAASAAGWDVGTSVKLRIFDWEDSVQHNSVPDPTLQSTWQGRPSNIPTTKQGTFSFSVPLEGGSANTTANPMATLLSKIFGGLQNPTTDKTDLADNTGTHTSTRVYASGIGAKIVPGMAVLVGTRGDGRGNGEVRVISAESTDYFDVDMAFSAAPSDGDAIVLSHTVYYSPTATQSYLDFLMLGDDEVTPDQKQFIGCMGSVELSGLGFGELPQVKFNMMPASWQHVPQGELEAKSTATPSGNDPAQDRALGGLFLQDNGTTTRAVISATNFSISPNINYEKVPGPNGINGIDGWKLLPPENGPTLSFTALKEQAYATHALVADFEAKTAKQILFQFGHAAQKCCAISFRKWFIDRVDQEADINGISAVTISGHGDQGSTSSEILGSPMAIHFF